MKNNRMSEEMIDVENDIKLVEYNQRKQNQPLELITKVNSAVSLNTEERKVFDFVYPLESGLRKNNEVSKYTFSQITNSYERENWNVSTDHCYARPWNWRPENSFLRPTKTLFFSKSVTGKRKSVNPLAPLQDIDDVVDIEALPELSSSIYDIDKAKHLMNECDNYASSARMDEIDYFWEDKISRNNWTSVQNRIFNGMVYILNCYNLSKLAQTGVHNEPLLRRAFIDKAVQRVRRLLATVAWESKLIQWLHQILIDNLESNYLGAYLDILQTLRSRLPTFIDKMINMPNSSVCSGAFCNANLHPLLEKQWDPTVSSLVQDKPKKLPGNPVIILVPFAPLTSKRINKWIKLFSHLGSVTTVPTNFGPVAHRMTITNCVDQMFSVTRSKIQDIKSDYPGRHIILLGFNAGGTLALQIAQVEPVLCVISLGFSLLTAEGKRGEPDDNLLELQCPVLFVIGQCSNTSLQEDVEDLRERMRVETGLIVVGSGDDYLRVNKKKRKSEGISQNIVDRCIVDEVGEFISSIILSPFPPQIRQSPNHTPSELGIKKSKTERKRYNSNTSSLDSEPPSPTPKISRSCLNNSPTNTRMTAFGFNRSITQNINSSTVLHGAIKTVTTSQPKSSSGIKVLENVTLNTSTTAKLISSSNRTIDLSKITVINSVKGNNAAVGNVLLLPDGKLKTVQNPSIKGTGGTPILLPLSPQKGLTKANKGRFITAKRQLIGAKLPRPLKKTVYTPSSIVETSLPPPTNLTTQDIMDLPIIFADDNQILDSTGSTNLSSNTTISNSGTSKILSSQISGKFMLVNKQTGSPGNYIITPSTARKHSSITFNKHPPKYTKIILSSKKNNVDELKCNSQAHNFSPEITVKKVPSSESLGDKTQNSSMMELIDLENEIEATTVPKPNVLLSDVKNITILPKVTDNNIEHIEEGMLKRSLTVANIVDHGDPDYIPPKNLKLESC